MRSHHDTSSSNGPIGRRAALALAAVFAVTACDDDGSSSGTTVESSPSQVSTTSSPPPSSESTTASTSTDTSETTEPEEEEKETLPTLLPLAPDSERVDLGKPAFSDPTNVDNPLFPISDLHSAVLVGNNEGHPIRIETTLMSEPKIVEVDGEAIETLYSQFVSYEDGRLVEVATDWYAQGDDGAVYYLGEDVFNYEDGVIADTDGTWVAGKDGAPIAMIMPADPEPGDVFRPENIEGVLMEEVTVKEVGVTVDGPYGKVDGAIIAQENHTLEGVYEDKWFAPGYGEFFSGAGDSLEGLAMGIPTGALDGPVPQAVTDITDGALAIFDAAAAGEWDDAESILDDVKASWTSHEESGEAPWRLAVQMDRALRQLEGDAMVPAVLDHNAEGTRNAALAVAQAAVDLQVPYHAQEEIDHIRFQLWAHQLVADASRIEVVPGFISGDVATLEWVWPRFSHTVDPEVGAAIESQLEDLRAAADEEDVTTVVEAAPAFLEAALAL